MAGPGIPSPKRDAGPFKETDTDLGKFSHGNFDAEYVPHQAKLQITFRAKYEFESGIPLAHQTEMKLGMKEGMRMWDQSGVYLRTRTPDALNEIIAIRFQVIETGDYNKIVDVSKDPMRPFVFRDLNISIDWRNDTTTLAHELGHVLGNYDEYGGTGFMGWLERRMWWHDNDHLDDTQSLMNGGVEFRTRYFDHFQKFINEHFEDLAIRYDLVQGPRVSLRNRPRISAYDPDEENCPRPVAYGYAPEYAGPKRLPGPRGI